MPIYSKTPTDFTKGYSIVYKADINFFPKLQTSLPSLFLELQSHLLLLSSSEAKLVFSYNLYKFVLPSTRLVNIFNIILNACII